MKKVIVTLLKIYFWADVVAWAVACGGWYCYLQNRNRDWTWRQTIDQMWDTIVDEYKRCFNIRGRS